MRHEFTRAAVIAFRTRERETNKRENRNKNEILNGRQRGKEKKRGGGGGGGGGELLTHTYGSPTKLLDLCLLFVKAVIKELSAGEKGYIFIYFVELCGAED